MHNWQWQSCEGLLYLTCSLLEKWPHGFFTRHFWPHEPEELTQVLQPQAKVYRVKQVHGNLVLTPTELEARGQGARSKGELGDPSSMGIRGQKGDLGDLGDLGDNYELLPADGLMTEQALQAVWVASADCTPVLIADAKSGQVAAVHAGWRGTAQKIVPQAIARLQLQGSQIQDLRIALGPAIAGSVYQVSEQVAAEVGASIIADQEEAAILQVLSELPDSPILPDSHLGRVRLDIRRVIALQLEQLGISPFQVAIAPHCTYQEPNNFFSYRRDKLKKVQWSGIVSL